MTIAWAAALLSQPILGFALLSVLSAVVRAMHARDRPGRVLSWAAIFALTFAGFADLGLRLRDALQPWLAFIPGQPTPAMRGVDGLLLLPGPWWIDTRPVVFAAVACVASALADWVPGPAAPAAVAHERPEPMASSRKWILLATGATAFVLAAWWVPQLSAVKAWRERRAAGALDAFENPSPDASLADRLAPARLAPAVVDTSQWSSPDEGATLVTIAAEIRVDGRRVESQPRPGRLTPFDAAWTQREAALRDARIRAEQRQGRAWNVLLVPDARARCWDVVAVWALLLELAAEFGVRDQVTLGCSLPSARGDGSLVTTLPTAPDSPPPGRAFDVINASKVPWPPVLLIAKPEDAPWAEVAVDVLDSLGKAAPRVALDIRRD